MKAELHFRVDGSVQGVMFRQTLIRAAQRRDLVGAATNLSDGGVACYLSGERSAIEAILATLRAGEAINSWGARVAALIELDPGARIEFADHQVTTANVDRFDWSPDVEMYL